MTSIHLCSNVIKRENKKKCREANRFDSVYDKNELVNFPNSVLLWLCTLSLSPTSCYERFVHEKREEILTSCSCNNLSFCLVHNLVPIYMNWISSNTLKRFNNLKTNMVLNAISILSVVLMRKHSVP